VESGFPNLLPGNGARNQRSFHAKSERSGHFHQRVRAFASLDQLQVVLGVIDEEHRVIDHDEVLGLGRALFGQQLHPGHSHQLDGHAVGIALDVGAGRIRVAVRKANPGVVGLAGNESALSQVLRQNCVDRESGAHTTMRLGMRVPSRRSFFGRILLFNPPADQLRDGLGRGHFAWPDRLAEVASISGLVVATGGLVQLRPGKAREADTTNNANFFLMAEQG
jgi:hypothetical protein